MYIKRQLDLAKLLKDKSYFLFGARGTGKSQLIKKTLGNKALIIDLLKSDYYLRLSARPSELEQIIKAQKKKLIVIDEIQKIPLLLNEVHRLIEEDNYRFLLTGSSARRLKKENANMLSNRAWRAELFPLTSQEITITENDLLSLFQFGSIASIYGSKKPTEEVDAYVASYLVEEIQAESWVRKLPQFNRFLRVAALANTEVLNFEKIASDAQIAPSTVREYFYLLSDTLMGFMLEPWRASKKRKAIASAKFYFFDLAIAHALVGTKHIEPNSSLFGKCFEHFIILETKAALSYQRRKDTLGFWRSTNQYEVDLTIGEDIAVEVKSSKSVNFRAAKNLRKLQEENVFKKFYLVSFDKIERVDEGISFIYYQSYLDKLWANSL